MSLEIITGDLQDAYEQLQPGTILHTDQLMNERRTNADLRSKLHRSLMFYAADGQIYFTDEEGMPILAITRDAQNPELQYKQLISTSENKQMAGYMFRIDLKSVLAAPNVVLISLFNLRLYEYNSKYGYLKISTTPAKYAELNEEERKFAERVYGQGDDFVQNMEMLKEANFDHIEMCVPFPDTVINQAEFSIFSQITRLCDFNYNYSNSSVFLRRGGRNNFIDCHCRACGVRRGSPLVPQK